MVLTGVPLLPAIPQCQRRRRQFLVGVSLDQPRKKRQILKGKKKSKKKYVSARVRTGDLVRVRHT